MGYYTLILCTVLYTQRGVCTFSLAASVGAFRGMMLIQNSGKYNVGFY